MKNIFKLIPFGLIALFFTACGDIDQDPYEINAIDGPAGSFIRLDITTSPVLDVTDIANTVFGGTLTAPSSNVASWDLKVRRVSAGVASDFVPLISIISFPSEFMANATNLSEALGLTVPDLLPGDRFDFEATTMDLDGNIVTFNDFGPNLQSNPGMAQSYRFNTFISCPFVQADALGTYIVTASNFSSFPVGNTFEVVAGDDSGQIIMQNPHGSADPDGVGYNIEVDVSPFGLATVPNGQSIFDTDVTGNAGFLDTTVSNGVGFAFSCAGSIILSMDYNLVQVGGGNFTWGSSLPFSAQKL